MGISTAGGAEGWVTPHRKLNKGAGASPVCLLAGCTRLGRVKVLLEGESSTKERLSNPVTVRSGDSKLRHRLAIKTNLFKYRAV